MLRVAGEKVATKVRLARSGGRSHGVVATAAIDGRLQLSYGIVHGIGNIDVAGSIYGDALWECELGLSSGAAVSVVAFDPGASDR